MTNSEAKHKNGTPPQEQVNDAMSASELQIRRIRWSTGLSKAVARNIVDLVYGEVRQ